MNTWNQCRFGLSLAIVLGASGALRGADTPVPTAPLPPVKEIVAKFVEALGGREAILKQSQLRGKGRFEMPAQGLSGDFEVFRAKPNRQLVKVNIPNLGQIVTGFDGETGWIVDPFMGARPMQGKVLQQMRDEAEFHSALHDAKQFSVMETVGQVDFEGTPCYEVKLVYRSGREVREFFDVQTHLLVGVKSVQETPQGSQPVTTRFLEYKKFGPVQHPTKMAQKIGDLEQTMTIDSLSYEPISDKEFAVPAAVKQ